MMTIANNNSLVSGGAKKESGKTITVEITRPCYHNNLLLNVGETLTFDVKDNAWRDLVGTTRAVIVKDAAKIKPESEVKNETAEVQKEEVKKEAKEKNKKGKQNETVE